MFKENLQIERNCEDSGNCVMHYLKGGPDRAFVSEDGNIYFSWIDIANGAQELFSSFHPRCSVVPSVSSLS